MATSTSDSMSAQTGDPGLDAIEHYYRIAQIDSEWSMREERGFSWWGHRLRQRVWADPPVALEGRDLVRIHARADLLRDVAPEGIAERLAALGTHASLCGLLYDRVERTVSYACSATFHAENVAWLRSLFALAAALQASLAFGSSARLPELLGGTLDASHHPRSGARVEPDDMLWTAETMPQAPPGWDLASIRRELAALSEVLTDLGCLATYGADGGLSAEFPWGPEGGPAIEGKRSSLLRVSTDERHAVLGQGILMRLYIPAHGAASELADLALELSGREEQPDAAYNGGYNLGQWCVAPLSGPSSLDVGLAYVSFVPAIGFRPGLLQNLAFSMSTRSRWAEGYVPAELVERWPLRLPGTGG